MILIVPSAVRDILKDYGSKPEIWDPTLLDSARSIFNNWVLDISQHDFSKRKTKTIVLVIGSPVESFCTKIVQKLRKDLLTFRVKIRNFNVFAHWWAKAISRKFWRKSWYSCYSLFPAILLFWAIWLKFRIHSNECAISCKTGFVLIRKWCGISCKKVISCTTTQLLRKRIDFYVETIDK